MTLDVHLFRGIVPFVAAAERGSVRAAGARLGISGAAVSKAIQGLERDAGVALFVRGRRLTLTTEGESFLAACRAAVGAVGEGRAELDAGRVVVTGELVLSAPFVVGGLVTRAVALLRSRHPGLVVSVRMTDRLSRLGEEGVDLAVRIGRLEDSSLVGRKVRASRLLTAAAPGYLTARGIPPDRAALAGHDTIVVVGPDGRPFDWWFRDGRVPVSAAIRVDYGPSVLDAVRAGLGIGQLFDWMAEPHLRDGSLVELFPAQVARGPDVVVVCAPGRQANARVRAGIEAVAEAFRG